jgi:uncharacterized membrane protein
MNEPARSSTSRWDAFLIHDRESCKKAIRNGGIAALIVGGISAAFGVTGVFWQSENERLNDFLDPWMLLDGILVLVLAIFVFLRSRTASTMLVVYYAGVKIVTWIELGTMQGLVVSIIVLGFLFSAMRGTFLWHSEYSNEDRQS